MSTEINPYAAPKALVEDVSASANPQAEAIRRAHIKHEASIRSIGILYYIGAISTAAAAVGAALELYTKQPTVNGAVTLVMFGLLTVGSFFIGRALRALQPGARTPITILATLGLLAFPIGTLINAYILYLVSSTKGRFILSQTTPQLSQLRRRSSTTRRFWCGPSSYYSWLSLRSPLWSRSCPADAWAVCRCRSSDCPSARPWRRSSGT